MEVCSGVLMELNRLHPGGHHYVDSMSWGSSKRLLCYAIATIDHYYASADSYEELLTGVGKNIRRGTPGNGYVRSA